MSVQIEMHGKSIAVDIPHIVQVHNIGTYLTIIQHLMPLHSPEHGYMGYSKVHYQYSLYVEGIKTSGYLLDLDSAIIFGMAQYHSPDDQNCMASAACKLLELPDNMHFEEIAWEDVAEEDRIAGKH